MLKEKSESDRELLKEKSESDRELLKEKSESDREVARIAADATTKAAHIIASKRNFLELLGGTVVVVSAAAGVLALGRNAYWQYNNVVLFEKLQSSDTTPRRELEAVALNAGYPMKILKSKMAHIRQFKGILIVQAVLKLGFPVALAFVAFKYPVAPSRNDKL